MKHITPSSVRQTTHRAINGTLKVFGAVFGALLIVLISGPAAHAIGPGDFFGCPDYSFLEGVAGTSRTVTGWIIAVAVIVGLFMMFVGAIGLATAGKRLDRAQDAQIGLVNVAKGFFVILIVLPVVIGIVAVIGTSFCTPAVG